MSNQLPANVRHALLFVSLVMLCGLTVGILAGRHLAAWWRNSITVRCLRWRLADLRAAMAYPFRLRSRLPKSTATVGVSPTPAVAVPHNVEVSHGADQ